MEGNLFEIAASLVFVTTANKFYFRCNSVSSVNPPLRFPLINAKMYP